MKVGRKMLYGEYKHTLDAKNRIFIPAAYREQLGDTFVVTRSFRGSFLSFYSQSAWDAYIAPLTEVPRKTSEDILRFLYRNAAEVTPDAQGRILLPQALVEYAGLSKTAYIIGCGNYGEIMSEQLYGQKTENENISQMREALEALGL